MSNSEIHNLHGDRMFVPSAPKHGMPADHGKHKPGVKATPSDHATEFNAETLPPGSAPPENTFQPQPTETVPGQAVNEDVLRAHGKESTHTPASATLGSTTSKDLNKGMGKPMEGQTKTEIRHEGEHGRKRQGAGLEGVGASQDGTQADLRRLERDDEGTRGASFQERGILAEERAPQSAETLSSEEQHHGGKPKTT